MSNPSGHFWPRGDNIFQEKNYCGGTKSGSCTGWYVANPCSSRYLQKVLFIHPRFSRTSCINCQNIGFTTGQVQGTYCLKNPRNLTTKLVWTVWMDYIGMRDCDPLSLSLSPGISILYVIHSLEGHLSFCPQNAKCVILPIWVNRNKIFDQARFFSLKSGHSGKRDSYYQAAYDSTWFLTFIYHKARTKTVNFVTPFLWYLPPSGPMIFTQTPLNC